MPGKLVAASQGTGNQTYLHAFQCQLRPNTHETQSLLGLSAGALESVPVHQYTSKRGNRPTRESSSASSSLSSYTSCDPRRSTCFNMTRYMVRRNIVLATLAVFKRTGIRPVQSFPGALQTNHKILNAACRCFRRGVFQLRILQEHKKKQLKGLEAWGAIQHEVLPHFSLPITVAIVPKPLHVGGCQNYDPFWGTLNVLNIRCRI